MGGSARIPAIKSALQQMLGSFSVLANLNGDESAALGCIYYGSGSKFARNKLEQVWDIPTFPLYATLYRSEPLPLQFGEEETSDDYAYRSYAFLNCEKLELRVLPGLERVFFGHYAFYYCRSVVFEGVHGAVA